MSSQGNVQQSKKKITDYFTEFAERWVPDSYVIALVLSVVAFVLAAVFTPASPYKIVQAWGKGFWTLLEFSMQMSLIVITGYALATTPLCKKLIASVCNKPTSAPQVYLWVSHYFFHRLLSQLGFWLGFCRIDHEGIGQTSSKKRDFSGLSLLVRG